MILRYFYDERLAHASYLVGCGETGDALVLDPARDITPYLQTAQEQGLSIRFVAETHIHADFVSGSRQLASLTDAQIIVSGEGGLDWQYRLPQGDNVRIVTHGDTILVGNVVLEVLHTPGHTPEHIAYLLTDTKTTLRPIGIFTGDCLFVGDMGRPDLLDNIANQRQASELGARLQFRNVQTFRTMPDYLQIWAAHGAGSACGKALGAIPSTTLGYEKLVNPAFQIANEDEFVAWLLDGQPDIPRYFAQMKRVNQNGAPLLHTLGQPQHIADVPDTDIVPEQALFIDTRPNADFAQQHIADSINIPISANGFGTYVGSLVDYTQPTFFIAYQTDVQTVINALLAIGVDDVRGYFTPDVIERSPRKNRVQHMTAKQIAQAQLPILDVRGTSEYRAEHIPNTYAMPLGDVLTRMGELPPDTRFAVQCGSGVRSQLVVSLLQKYGYRQVVNMQGGITAWKKAGLPTQAS
jgi:hydroxyacylglutathione hydrolase